MPSQVRACRLLIAILFALAAALGVTRLNAATPYFVALTGDDGNDCLSMATACRTIGAALQKAAPADILIVADGVYSGNLLVDKDITLIGFGADITTILGDGAQRVLTVSSGVVANFSNVSLIDGLTRTAGYYAAGIWVEGTLRLSRSVVSGNSSGGILSFGVVEGHAVNLHQARGAALYNYGSAALSHSIIENNVAGIVNHGNFTLSDSRVTSQTLAGVPGAGVSNYGTMTIENSIIRGNTVLAESGGGVYNQGQLTVNETLIISNTAYSPPPPIGGNNPEATTQSWGGGIYSYFGTITLTNSTVAGNSANSGGDQIEVGGSVIFVNVTLSGDDGHHGIETGGSITLTNVTIANMPSGIGFWGSAVAVNTIISNAPCISGLTSLGYNLESGNSCGLNATGDLTNTNPLLGPLQNNGGATPTHALLPGSPAINRGDTVRCPATDQRGLGRPQAGRCDIGAYEYVFPFGVRLPFLPR